MPIPPQVSEPAPFPSAGSIRRAFTLVELLVTMTVLIILLLMMVGLTNQTNKIWRGSRARTTAFQGARNAFARITTNLSQATLNTYLDYYNSAGLSRADVIKATYSTSTSTVNFQPATYDRAAELQFVCGQSDGATNPLIPSATTGARPTHALFFQSPAGHVTDPYPANSVSTNDFKDLTGVLNSIGYYIDFTNDSDLNSGQVPEFMKSKPPVASWRYRLMELNQPSENLGIYALGSPFSGANSWYAQAVSGTLPPVYAVADNIVALVIRPKAANPPPGGGTVTEIARSYAYDTKAYAGTPPSNIDGTSIKLSKNQLPPLVQVTLVAIDADSAARLASRYNANPPPLVNPALFTSVDSYDADMETLKTTLQGFRLNYRVFVADISLSGAKWSQAQ